MRKAAAAGADHLTAELLRRLPKVLHTSLREYLRLALVKRDLTAALPTTVLKWLPKSADEPAYIDNTTRGFPRLRPVGLNTVLSKVFEYILFEIQYKMNAGDKVKVDPMMFAWYRGRRTFSAAMIHQVTVEDAARRGAPLRTVSLDARHHFDTVHLATSVKIERAMGYPEEMIIAKASIKAGPMVVRTEHGLTRAIHTEQGLGQGRVDAPHDSNRWDTFMIAALSHGSPYVAFDGTLYAIPIHVLAYADDKNFYSGGTLPEPPADGGQRRPEQPRGAPIQGPLSDMTTQYQHEGQSFNTEKCVDRHINMDDPAALLELPDMTTGGTMAIKTVRAGEAVRYLGHHGSLDGKTEAGAEMLLQECKDEADLLRSPAVDWPTTHYSIGRVVGGKVGYKATVTKGMRRRLEAADRYIATLTQAKLGELRTSTRDYLWISDGLGLGLESAFDTWIRRLLPEVLTDMNDTGRAGSFMRGAAEAYRERSLTTTPWGRSRQPQPSGSKGGDGCLAERVHTALSALGWAILPARLPTRGPRAMGRPGWAEDGGRYADWRLADVLPPELLAATRTWRIRTRLEWMGQLLRSSGDKMELYSTWLHRLGAKPCIMAGKVHTAAEEALKAGWAASPLPRAPMEKVATLPIGQFALLPEVVLDEDDCPTFTESVLLVQGLAQDGGTDTLNCQDCIDLKCKPGAHAPIGYTTDGSGQSRLRVRRYAGTGGGGFRRASEDTYEIDVPNYFMLVRPRVYELSGEPHLTPFEDSQAEVRWKQQSARLHSTGEPILWSDWQAELQRHRDLWNDKTSADQPWQCEHCGEGRRDQGCDLSQRQYHRSCAGYQQKWASLLGQQDTRWVARKSGKMVPLESLALADLVDGDKVGTDASATYSSTGLAMVCERTAETARVKVVGRPQEIRISFVGEMAAGILLHLSAPSGGSLKWVGDNESALRRTVQLYEGWSMSEAGSNKVKHAHLLRWLRMLIEQMEAEGSTIVPKHQRSHLSTATAAKRAMDERMILEQADAAAAEARDSSVELNVSGIHDGVQGFYLCDHDRWRVGSAIGSAVSARRQEQRLQRWRTRHGDDTLQTRYLRMDPRRESMGHRVSEKGGWGRQIFTGKLFRHTLATSVARHGWDDRIDGGCPTCKWARLPDGYVGAAEVLTTSGGRSVWKPAKVTVCDHEADAVEYVMDGEASVAAVLAARMGRWVPHDQAHIFGVHLPEDAGRHRKLLARAVERHGRRAAIKAVHMLGGAEGAGIGSPYMTTVGWALRGRHPLCTTVQAAQSALHAEMTRRLRAALSGSLLLDVSTQESRALDSALGGAPFEYSKTMSARPGLHSRIAKVAKRLGSEQADVLGWLRSLDDDDGSLTVQSWLQSAPGGGARPAEIESRHASRRHWGKAMDDASVDGLLHCTLDYTVLQDELHSDLVKATNGGCDTWAGSPTSAQQLPGWERVEGPEEAAPGKTPMGKEQKVHRKRNIWAKDGRRLHESQMRRWQSVVPPDMMEATWGQLPSPPRMGRSWTLREGLVRAIAAATAITALAKVEIWNPYTIDVHKMGPVKSSGLRIRRRRWVHTGTVLFVAPPSKLDRDWIRQRPHTTLYVTRAIPRGAKAVATFAAGTMCPEWRDAAMGLRPRSAGRDTAVGEYHLVTSHGTPPAGLGAAVAAYMRTHSAKAPHRPHILTTVLGATEA